MDRRSFIKWLGGGLAATVALSSTTVEAAQRVLGVTGEFDPEKMLWIPGEAKVMLPPDHLIIEPLSVGAAAYRLSVPRLGTYWLDADGVVRDVLDTKGQPMSLLDGEGPDLVAVRRAIRETWGFEARKDSKLLRQEIFARSRAYRGEGELHRWPGLLPEPGDRDVVARMRLVM